MLVVSRGPTAFSAGASAFALGSAAAFFAAGAAFSLGAAAAPLPSPRAAASMSATDMPLPLAGFAAAFFGAASASPASAVSLAAGVSAPAEARAAARISATEPPGFAGEAGFFFASAFGAGGSLFGRRLIRGRRFCFRFRSTACRRPSGFEHLLDRHLFWVSHVGIPLPCVALGTSCALGWVVWQRRKVFCSSYLRAKRQGL